MDERVLHHNLPTVGDLLSSFDSNTTLAYYSFDFSDDMERTDSEAELVEGISFPTDRQLNNMSCAQLDKLLSKWEFNGTRRKKLTRIRRNVHNKEYARENRRRKKAYVDQLESDLALAKLAFQESKKLLTPSQLEIFLEELEWPPSFTQDTDT